MTIVAFCEWIVCAFLGILEIILLWKVATNYIDLKYLISDGQGDASMSRFQLLVFTFVVAMSLFIVVSHGERPAFPEIPGGVLALLGVSASSFLVSKSIGAGAGTEAPPRDTPGGQPGAAAPGTGAATKPNA